MVKNFVLANNDSVSLDPSIVFDYEKARALVLPRVSMPGGRFDRFPHSDFLDMIVTYYIDLGTTKNGQEHATAPVTAEILEKWPATLEEVHAAAVSNISGHPVPLADVIGIPADACPMQVLTNDNKFYGAALLLNSEIMDAAAADGSIIVLPSSVHEVLYIPLALRPYGCTFEDLAEMVQLINGTEVLPEEVLSNNVYLYTAGKGLKLATEATAA